MAALHGIRPHPIVHRDLKATNILLANGRLLAKIADFGLAKFTSASTGNTYGVGTLSHSGPETFWGIFNEDSDTFAYGILLYEIVCRVVAWATEGKSTQEIDEAVKARFKFSQRRLDKKGETRVRDFLGRISLLSALFALVWASCPPLFSLKSCLF